MLYEKSLKATMRNNYSREALKPIFSEKLIEKYKTVFERRTKREISDEEAEIHLHKLGIIGLLAHKSYSQGNGRLEERK